MRQNFSQIQLDLLRNDTDEVYGDGYRKMNNCLEKHGFDGIIRKMWNYKTDCFYEI